jgi:hypothetical protein
MTPDADYIRRIQDYQKNAERARVRTRYLYALVFHDGDRVYVGQSVEPRRRNTQHRQMWGREKYTMHVLSKITGTYADAEEMEYAWRKCAKDSGFEVYGMKGVVVNPDLRMTPARAAAAARLRWPASARRKGRIRRVFKRLGAGLALGVVLAATGWLLLPVPLRESVGRAAHVWWTLLGH